MDPNLRCSEKYKGLKRLEAVENALECISGYKCRRTSSLNLREVVDNSIDEAMAGYCDTLDAEITNDGSVVITDNGRGDPRRYPSNWGIPAATVVLTVLHTQAVNLIKDSYKVSGGLHGVGISVVNALSKKLILTIENKDSQNL